MKKYNPLLDGSAKSWDSDRKPQWGFLIPVAIGAVTGALSNRKNPLQGALIGGTLGAFTGGLGGAAAGGAGAAGGASGGLLGGAAGGASGAASGVGGGLLSGSSAALPSGFNTAIGYAKPIFNGLQIAQSLAPQEEQSTVPPPPPVLQSNPTLGPTSLNQIVQDSNNYQLAGLNNDLQKRQNRYQRIRNLSNIG